MSSQSSWSSHSNNPSQSSYPPQSHNSANQSINQSGHPARSNSRSGESCLPVEVACSIVVYATDAAFTQLQTEPQSQEAALMQLYALYGAVLEKAVSIVDRGYVTLVRASPSNRFAFSIHGSNNQSDSAYICSLHHCSCPAFTNSVAMKTEHLYCKHQLAARLAYALNKIKVTELSDAEFHAAMMKDRLRPANQWEQREPRPFNSKFKSHSQH